MSQHYSDPRREADPHALPDVEVFYMERGTQYVDPRDGVLHGWVKPGQSAHDCKIDQCWPCEAGWYWWPCFPGCLPDGDPVGPFLSEELALEDARSE